MTTQRHSIIAVLSLLATMATAVAAANGASCDDATLHGTAEDIGSPPDFTGFGSAVAISGDTALVGLPNRTVDEQTVPRGRVAVYTCDPRAHTWVRTGSLDPVGARDSESRFGSALELQGQRLAVGSENAVRLYENGSRSKKGASDEWRLVLKLTANGVDRLIVPIIAYDPPYLAVTVVKVVNDQPVRFIDLYIVTGDNRARRVARLQPSEDFGELDLNNGVLVAGPQVYTRRKDGSWRLQQLLQATPSDDSFGSAGVAISRRTILIGSPLEGRISGDDGLSGGGAVYVFELQHGVWQQTQRIRPDTEAYAFDGFGQTLAFDGHFAAIGAPFALGGFQREHGPTFLYRESAERFALDRTFPDAIATSIDLSQRQLIIGTNVTVQGTPITGASVQRLQ